MSHLPGHPASFVTPRPPRPTHPAAYFAHCLKLKHQKQKKLRNIKDNGQEIEIIMDNG